MKPLPWLRHDRQTDTPGRALSEAALGNVCLASVTFVTIAALCDASRAAPAAAFGTGIVVLASAVAWLLSVVVARLEQDPALYLLIGYVLKAMVGGVFLLLIPFPHGWSGGWALSGAIIGVVVVLGTQLWVIRRLRIPYFSTVESLPERHDEASDHDEDGRNL